MPATGSSAATATDLQPAAIRAGALASRDILQSSWEVDAITLAPQLVTPALSMQSEAGADFRRQVEDETLCDPRATSGRWEESATGEPCDLVPYSHLQQMRSQTANGGEAFCSSGGPEEGSLNTAARGGPQQASRDDATACKSTTGDDRSRLPPQPNTTVNRDSPHSSPTTQPPIDSSTAAVLSASFSAQPSQALDRADTPQNQLMSPVHQIGAVDQVPFHALQNREQAQRIAQIPSTDLQPAPRSQNTQPVSTDATGANHAPGTGSSQDRAAAALTEIHSGSAAASSENHPSSAAAISETHSGSAAAISETHSGSADAISENQSSSAAATYETLPTRAQRRASPSQRCPCHPRAQRLPEQRRCQRELSAVHQRASDARAIQSTAPTGAKTLPTRAQRRASPSQRCPCHPEHSAYRSKDAANKSSAPCTTEPAMPVPSRSKDAANESSAPCITEPAMPVPSKSTAPTGAKDAAGELTESSQRARRGSCPPPILTFVHQRARRGSCPLPILTFVHLRARAMLAHRAPPRNVPAHHNAQ